MKRSDFPDMDDVEYSNMMKMRRRAQETQRDRGRDRKGRSYPAREQEQPPPQSSASPPQHRRPSTFAGWQTWKSAWSEEMPQLVMDGPGASAYPDAWYYRLETKHGFVAGNMLTKGIEEDRLYAAARQRRQCMNGCCTVA